MQESAPGEAANTNPRGTVADSPSSQILKRPRGRPRNPITYLPASRVGRLETVDDWAAEFSRVYRAVRRGELSTTDGAKLAYMAMTGKQLAEAKFLREQVPSEPGEPRRPAPSLGDMYATIQFVEAPARDGADDGLPTDGEPGASS